MSSFGSDTLVLFTHVTPLAVLHESGFTWAPSGPLVIGQHHAPFVSVEEDPALGRRIAREFAGVDVFVALTDDDAARFAEVLPVPCYALPNPARPLSAVEEAAIDHGGARPRTAVALARLSPVKQLDLMIRAFVRATAAPGLQDWRLRIFGEGSERAALERVIDAAGAGDRVELMGEVDDVGPVLDAAAVNLLTSRYEGFGMSPEAHRGVPTWRSTARSASAPWSPSCTAGSCDRRGTRTPSPTRCGRRWSTRWGWRSPVRWPGRQAGGTTPTRWVDSGLVSWRTCSSGARTGERHRCGPPSRAVLGLPARRSACSTVVPDEQQPGHPMSLVAIVTRVTRRYLPPGSGVLFDQDARRKLVLAFIGSVVLAAMELLGLGALLLLMQQLTPAADKGAVLEGISDALGDPGPRAMIAILSGLVLVVFVAKGLFALRFRWWLLHFLARQEAHTAGRLLVGYVKGPYWRVLQRKGSDLIRSMFENNNAVYGMVIGPYMLIATEGLTVLAVFVFLLFVMPIPTIAAVGFLGLAALGLNAAVRARARRLGEELSDASGRSFRAALHAVRDQGDQGPPGGGALPRRLPRRPHPVGQPRATMIFLGEMPRYVLEVLFIISALLVIGLLFVTAGEGQALSLIALFVAAGFRILPSVVRIVGARNSVEPACPRWSSSSRT